MYYNTPLFSEIYKAYWRISDSLVKIKRSIVEIIEAWNIKIVEVTRKKDIDKKKDKPITVDLDNSPSEEALISIESQENVNKIVPGERNSVILSKKVKSLDSSDSMWITNIIFWKTNFYFLDESCSSSPKSHHRSQSDVAVISCPEDSAETKKDSDKKMVKNILSHLLPSSTNSAIIPVSYG